MVDFFMSWRREGKTETRSGQLISRQSIRSAWGHGAHQQRRVHHPRHPPPLPLHYIAIIVSRSTKSPPSSVITAARSQPRSSSSLPPPPAVRRTPLSRCPRPSLPLPPAYSAMAAVALHWVAVLVCRHLRCPCPHGCRQTPPSSFVAAAAPSFTMAVGFFTLRVSVLARHSRHCRHRHLHPP